MLYFMSVTKFTNVLYCSYYALEDFQFLEIENKTIFDGLRDALACGITSLVSKRFPANDCKMALSRLYISACESLSVLLLAPRVGL